MSTATSWVNAKALKQSRLQSGLTQEQVQVQAQKLARSQYVGVTSEQLGAWEGGTEEPELAQLETLSEIYDCPVGQFFLDEVPKKAEPLSYRGLAPGKEKRLDPDTIRSIRRFLKLQEWFTAAIREHEVAWRVQLQTVGERPDVDRLVAEQRLELGFSDSVRREWRTNSDALAWWRRRIEDRGVFCIELKLKPSDVRGASIWSSGGYPFILLNHQDGESATGRLFTLLHEYGHLIMSGEEHGIACDFHGRGSRDGEPRANHFAARMLVSPEELRESLNHDGRLERRDNWPDSELDRLRKPFFVSRDVVAIMLQEMELAPGDFYRRKRAAWERQYANQGARGWGKPAKKWERKVREFGASGIRTFVTLHEKASLPTLDFAYMFDTKVEKVGEFVQEFRQVLQR